MKKKTNRTYIGGQAVIQGVMMRGKSGMATVVRDDNGELQTEALRIKPPSKRPLWMRMPFIRGVVNFVTSLVGGMQALMRSAEAAYTGEEEEKSKLSQWMEDHLKIGSGDVISTISVVLGVIIAVGLFVVLPKVLAGLIAGASNGVIGIDPETATPLSVLWYHLIAGGFRLIIFAGYILFTLMFKSLRETYMCHGAEHMTINCFEYGMPLTVENVKKCSRMHDRCGTTFMFIVLMISILVFAAANVPLYMLFGELNISNQVLQSAISIAADLLLLPVVAGVSYEVLKILSYTDFVLFAPLKWPGYLLQKLTTRKPTDEQIECAILAFEKVRAMDADPEIPEQLFATETKLSKLSALMKKSFKEKGIDESDAEWILSITLKIPRSSLSAERVVYRPECKEILRVFEERLTGRPLWYIYGDAEFYGYTFKVDERVLIPRPETEILVREAVASLNAGDSLLDLCTGSGAVAVATACEAAKDKSVTVVAADISEEALEVARENARLNKANVSFVKSDLFANVHGRYNVIAVNPPYIKTSEIETLPKDVRDFEPRLALDGGEDGLDFYRRIAAEVGRYIVRGGIVILECGEDQAQEIIKIFQTATHCDYAMVVKDLAGVERIVKIGF